MRLNVIPTTRTRRMAPRSTIEELRELTYPPPYPEGWYVVARSASIKDKPKFVYCAGNAMAIFRNSSGDVCAIDAYCPHMGANLADGTVCNGHIRCPFHGWEIDGNGQVREGLNGDQRKAPYQTGSWAVDELHGWVCVFHRRSVLENGPPPKPLYRPQHLPEIDDGSLIFRGEHDAGEVRMHLIEFAENSVDFRHFAAIHGRLRVPWTDIPVPGMTLHHKAAWRRDDVEPHVCWFENEAHLRFRDAPIPDSGASALVRMEGPGGVIRFDFALKRRKGRIVMFQSHTPTAPLIQRVRFRWFSEPEVPKLLASYVAGNWVSQWRRDIEIWERKIYRNRPLLSRGDGPIHQLRRWYAQFYPDMAPSSLETSAPLS